MLKKEGEGILQAYDVLHQSRLLYEGGPQAVQVSEVMAYLEIARIDAVEDRLLFLNTIKMLDVIYLNHYAEHKK